MTPVEGETAVLGGIAVAGAVIAVAREAVRRNWIVVKVSFAVTAPDARWPKLPKARETARKPGSAPVVADFTSDGDDGEYIRIPVQRGDGGRFARRSA